MSDEHALSHMTFFGVLEDAGHEELTGANVASSLLALIKDACGGMEGSEKRLSHACDLGHRHVGYAPC